MPEGVGGGVEDEGGVGGDVAPVAAEEFIAELWGGPTGVAEVGVAVGIAGGAVGEPEAGAAAQGAVEDGAEGGMGGDVAEEDEGAGEVGVALVGGGDEDAAGGGRARRRVLGAAIRAMLALMNWARLTLMMAVCAACCQAEDAVVKALKGQMDGFRQNTLEAAAKVAAADYAFKPAPEVMSFHQLLAHITDANYSICAPLKNEANPNTTATEKKAAGKDVIPALTASFDYCDAALAGLDDAKLATKIKRGTTERPLAYYALHLLDHTALHYGNLITYMRLKGVVPPETERRNQQAAPKK